MFADERIQLANPIVDRLKQYFATVGNVPMVSQSGELALIVPSIFLLKSSRYSRSCKIINLKYYQVTNFRSFLY